MRGEHPRLGTEVFVLLGSSLRARGARAARRVVVGRVGIIPACAGSTGSSVTPPSHPWDHPRVCGEHWEHRAYRMMCTGSSPRARGARGSLPRMAGCEGIIPACAGSTRSSLSRRRWTRDHPRVRGEHTGLFTTLPREKGSSPRARGARDYVEEIDGPVGIIPACAGSTDLTLLHLILRWDHPRVRGEHGHPGRPLPAAWGSSPRARGARDYVEEIDGPVGIIPACAGSTDLTLLHLILRWDHPRVRGEHGHPGRPLPAAWGSSPRARGARTVTLMPHPRRGIIPACAGSTSFAAGLSSPKRDHPRVRGEHPLTLASGMCRSGSSPRARGARPRHDDQLGQQGIIPACAGSTVGVELGRRRESGSSPRARGARPNDVDRLLDTGIIPACAGSTSFPRRGSGSPGDHPRVRGEHPSHRARPPPSAGSSPRARGAPT